MQVIYVVQCFSIIQFTSATRARKRTTNHDSDIDSDDEEREPALEDGINDEHDLIKRYEYLPKPALRTRWRDLGERVLLPGLSNAAVPYYRVVDAASHFYLKTHDGHDVDGNHYVGIFETTEQLVAVRNAYAAQVQMPKATGRQLRREGE